MESALRQTSRRNPQVRFLTQDHSMHCRNGDYIRRLPPLVTDHNDHRLLKLLNQEL